MDMSHQFILNTGNRCYCYETEELPVSQQGKENTNMFKLQTVGDTFFVTRIY
jgi:hypothetical protein